MWWRERKLHRRLAWPLRLAVVLAAAGLTAGCWQPLYSAHPVPGGEGVQDKFASVDIPRIIAPQGTPAERLAVGMFNALQFDLHNGQTVFAPAYQLKVNVAGTQFTSYLDPVTGRPELVDRVGHHQLSADRACHRQDGPQRYCLCPCQLRHPRFAAALRRAAGAARRRGSRHRGRGRRDQEPAGVVFRGWDLAFGPMRTFVIWFLH